MMCECGKPKRHARADGCDDCERLDNERYARINEGLTGDVRRLLARHYPDWLEGGEIREVVNNRETSGALWRLRMLGEVEQRPRGRGKEYRLTKRRAA